MDKIVQSVLDKYVKRSEVGIKKYGTTLEQNNTDDFLNHLQEELMDAVLYIEKLKHDTDNSNYRRTIYEKRQNLQVGHWDE
jgi:hypothetical protein